MSNRWRRVTKLNWGNPSITLAQNGSTNSSTRRTAIRIRSRRSSRDCFQVSNVFLDLGLQLAELIEWTLRRTAKFRGFSEKLPPSVNRWPGTDFPFVRGPDAVALRFGS